MKKFIALLAVFFVTAVSAKAEMLGLIYQEATSPGNGYNAVAANKTGISECKSVFGIVGFGDCSVQTAMKNGNIKVLGGYDVYRQNILGFMVIKTRAWGN